MPPDDAALAAALRFVADHEPLAATEAAHPGAVAGVRRALRQRADALQPRPPAAPAAPTAVVAPAAAAAPAGVTTPAAAGRRLVVYSDGASRGNPGPSGAGWVICDEAGAVVAEGGIFLGRRTNNEAEYVAAAMGLEAVRALGRVDAVRLRADSELLVRQVQGRYRVKNARLLPLYEQVMRLSRQFASFTAEHVRRELNEAADHQANLAVDRGR